MCELTRKKMQLTCMEICAGNCATAIPKQFFGEIHMLPRANQRHHFKPPEIPHAIRTTFQRHHRRAANTKTRK
ncbi:hypothetical protein TMES_16590 [Thalassospira mesophila]|uniref:Uncharacterized protein n=1 Tax=Thalassospira mesophila TaxID=1293891 RepID=A0A1Y2KXG6_9PROT|nr:hypothetical protein TMES_16590 [Thalassospira mesophila]